MPRSMLELLIVMVLMSPAAANEPSRQLKSAFGRQTIAVIREAESVEVIRLKSIPRGERLPANTKTLDGQRIISRRTVSKNRRKRLSALFATDSSFEWDAEKPLCIPIPGVVFRFRKGRDVAHVHVCFDCRQILIGQHSTKREAQESWIDFRPSHDTLLKIVKAIFAKDSEIKKLELLRKSKD